jgi:hypothetical protein
MGRGGGSETFLLVTLGTGGRDLLVAEESECDLSLVSEGQGEAGILCAGEDMPVSQLPDFLADG